MFAILVNAAFYLEEIQQSDIIINQTNTRSMVFGTAILRKTDILIKLTKNLVIIASSIWTKYLIKKTYIPPFALPWNRLTSFLLMFDF